MDGWNQTNARTENWRMQNCCFPQIKKELFLVSGEDCFIGYTCLWNNKKIVFKTLLPLFVKGRMSPRFAIVADFSCLTSEGQAKDENKKQLKLSATR